MHNRFAVHPFSVVETSFAPEDMRFGESLMSLGNGAMGLRGNFEEDYSGDTHRGTYIGGVWFPDKTRVGWWKNGYPRYFGKVINAVNLIGLHVQVNGQTLDAGKLPVTSFRRELDMQRGVLIRRMVVLFPEGEVEIKTERFVSMADQHILALRYEVKPSFAAEIVITQYLDGNVHNEDSNYDEIFWEQLQSEVRQNAALVVSRTEENPFGTPRFTVGAASLALTDMVKAGEEASSGFASVIYQQRVEKGQSCILHKIVSVATDRDMTGEEVPAAALHFVQEAAQLGYGTLLSRHEEAWQQKWDTADVQIEGDDAAQQGIRFNLFQLLSTYTGEDARLNIGPKGFTGEKYGGATYWDTEAFCFPVYMAISGDEVAKQLLLYRHGQLPQAYGNAAEQGLPGALYPMVTFNGTECHNEWEITFMELHRNGAMAYAIFNYMTYTGDTEYLKNEGLDVLVGIARFWAGRVHWNDAKQVYMMHGVTGPNEYENNVNNNWYTNRIAAWCLTFCKEAAELAGSLRRAQLQLSQEELDNFQRIADQMYYPEDKEKGIFVQHDTFLDKLLQPASSIPHEDRPLNQHWSWDRILRSCFIKQGDVLQGLYTLGHLYDKETKRRNFAFYEPMTVHESSLSPCVHAILAAEIGDEEKAVEMYQRTARLDLDNINNDTQDGLHITSMSGSWLAIAQGFAGMRTVEGLSFAPMLPRGWQGYSFRFIYRGRVVQLKVEQETIALTLEKGEPLSLKVYDEQILLEETTVLTRR